MLKNIFIVFMLLFIIGEVVVRLFITSPSNQVYDPEIGWVYIPYTKILHAKEGFARNSINNLGFNDEDFVREEGNDYILFLGDSFTEAMHVERKFNFTSLLEKKGLISINAGRSALNPLHYRIVYKRISKVLIPDKTVLVLSSGDIYEMMIASVSIKYTDDQKISSLTIKSSQKDNVKRLIEPIVQHSALATHLMRRLKPMVFDILQYWKKSKPQKVTHRKRNREQHREMLLSFILDELNQNNSLFIIYVPEVEFDSDGALFLAQDIEEEGLMIKGVAQKLGIPYVNAYTHLNEEYIKTHQPPYGFNNSMIGEGHLNESGHVVIADVIQMLIKENK